VCVLAHKVEQQRKRQSKKAEFFKRGVRSLPFHKGSRNLPSGHTVMQQPMQPLVHLPYPLKTRPAYIPKHLKKPLLPPITQTQVLSTPEDISSARDKAILRLIVQLEE